MDIMASQMIVSESLGIIYDDPVERNNLVSLQNVRSFLASYI